jgi:hypothetical protein
MSVTSTLEVFPPCGLEFITVCLDDGLDLSKLLRRVPVILRQFDPGLKPEFGFSLGRADMYVYPIFLQREEEESISSLSKYGWAHLARLPPGLRGGKKRSEERASLFAAPCLEANCYVFGNLRP